MPSMTVDEIKAHVNAEIDRKGDEAIRISKDILTNPEPGFREHRTSKVVAGKFRDLGIRYEDGIGITGLKGILEGGSPGPTIGVMGEMDSLIVLGHPHANPNTNAAHACGHHAQIGNLLGVAMGLQAPGVLDNLSGRVALLVVPAEEYIEIEFRDDLRRAGKIEFLGGKPEFIRLGALDDVDISMMTHVESGPKNATFAMGGTNNGVVAKRIQFIGKAAHAGAYPQHGINALNASMIALSAIHAQRETYKDQDTIRIHPIITQGGVAVSSVPADVRMETFVRGSNVEAFLDASEKVDRACRAGALAVGGSVKITTLPGYLPIRSDSTLLDIHRANCAALVGENQIAEFAHRPGSTDMGDVSQIMPIIHPYVVSSDGVAHGTDFLVSDYGRAVIDSAKSMAMTVVDLLSDGGAKASEISTNYKAPMKKNEYLQFMRSQYKEETFEE